MNEQRKEEPKIFYDEKSDTLYIVTKKGIEEEFVEIADGVNVEIDENQNVIGIEILKVSKVLAPVIKMLKQKVA